MGAMPRIAIFVAVVILTAVSMWTTYVSLKESILPEPVVTIPLGDDKSWDCSIFALGLSVAIGLMLFALKLAIIDGQKRLNLAGVMGLTVVAFISIAFNMDVLYRVHDKEFFIRHSAGKVKGNYDTYLATVQADLTQKKQTIEKQLARQEGELESEIRGLREEPAGYGAKARQEDYRLTVLAKEVAVEIAGIDEALASVAEADALLVESQPGTIEEIQALQDKLRVAVKNAGSLAGVPMPETVALESPLFAVFERLFDIKQVGLKEIFFLVLAFLIDLGDIVGYSLVPAHPNSRKRRRRTMPFPDDPQPDNIRKYLPQPEDEAPASKAERYEAD